MSTKIPRGLMIAVYFSCSIRVWIKSFLISVTDTYFFPLSLWWNLVALIMLLQLVRCGIPLRCSLSIYFYQKLFIPWFYHLYFASGTCDIIIYSSFECCPVISNALVWTCFWNEFSSSQNAQHCGILFPILSILPWAKFVS